MEDEEILEILKSERRITIKNINSIDKDIFNYIKVVVSPFILLVGYSFISGGNMRFVTLSIPFFTVFSIFVLSTLYVRMILEETYLYYITERINRILSEDIIISEYLSSFFIGSGFNIQNTFLVISFLAAFVLNVSILGYISELLIELSSIVNSFLFIDFKIVYWSFLILMVISLAGCMYNQFIRKKHYISKMAGIPDMKSRNYPD